MAAISYIFVVEMMVSMMLFCCIMLSSEVDAKELDCYTGYVMDTFCIERGTFVDKPDVTSLNHPEQHTVLCLIDPPECIASGYEMLGEPANEGQNYTRVVKFDDAGNQMFVTLAKQMGSGCNGCKGTRAEGLQATVVGLVGTSGTPPIMQVTKIFPSNTSCSSAMNPTGGTGGNNSTNTTNHTTPSTNNSSAVKLVYSSRFFVSTAFLALMMMMIVE